MPLLNKLNYVVKASKILGNADRTAILLSPQCCKSSRGYISGVKYVDTDAKLLDGVENDQTNLMNRKTRNIEDGFVSGFVSEKPEISEIGASIFFATRYKLDAIGSESKGLNSPHTERVTVKFRCPVRRKIRRRMMEKFESPKKIASGISSGPGTAPLPLGGGYGRAFNMVVQNPTIITQQHAYAHFIADTPKIDAKRFESPHTTRTEIDFKCPLPKKERKHRSFKQDARKMDCASLMEEYMVTHNTSIPPKPKGIPCKSKVSRKPNACGVIFECPKKKKEKQKEECKPSIAVLTKSEVNRFVCGLVNSIARKLNLNVKDQVMIRELGVENAENRFPRDASDSCPVEFEESGTLPKNECGYIQQSETFRKFSKLKEHDGWIENVASHRAKRPTISNLRISDNELLRISNKDSPIKSERLDTERILLSAAISQIDAKQIEGERNSMIGNCETLADGLIQLPTIIMNSSKKGGTSKDCDWSKNGSNAKNDYKPEPGQVCCPKDVPLVDEEPVEEEIKQVCCPPKEQRMKASGSSKASKSSSSQPSRRMSQNSSHKGPCSSKPQGSESKDSSSCKKSKDTDGGSQKASFCSAKTESSGSKTKSADTSRSEKMSLEDLCGRLECKSQEPPPPPPPPPAKKVVKVVKKKSDYDPDVFNCCLCVISKRKVEINNCPMPELCDDGVIVKMHSCALCPSDVHIFDTGSGSGDVRTQQQSAPVLGHEGTGVVFRVGKNVKLVKPGDSVAIEPGIACGVCSLCKSGRRNLCPEMNFRNMLQTYSTHPEHHCYKVQKNSNLEHCALAHTVALALYACRRGRVCVGTNVLILGACPIGLSAVMTARAMGADKIAIIDTVEKNLKVAYELCADKTILASLDTPVDQIAENVCSELKDNPNVVIDCCGCTKTVNLALLSLKTGGRYVLAGCQAECANVPILAALAKEISICTSFRTTDAFVDSLNLIQCGRAPVSKLITHRAEFCDAQEAFDYAVEEEKSGAIKVVVNWPHTMRKK